MFENIKERVDEIHALCSKGSLDIKTLLELGEFLEANERHTLSWFWPNENDLQNLKNVLKEINISSILSIGCGCGLLERILKDNIKGIDLCGLEVDRNWWRSVYAIKSFIPVNFVEDFVKDDEWNDNGGRFLQQCCQRIDWNFAVLFCYFNNRSAFLDYLNLYKGCWLIIIGPKTHSETFTDPNPLEPDFPIGSNWHLHQVFNVANNNVIAIYTNTMNKFEEN